MRRKITTKINNKEYFKNSRLHAFIEYLNNHIFQEDNEVIFLLVSQSSYPKFISAIRSDYCRYTQMDFSTEDKEYLGEIIDKFCYAYVNGLKFNYELYLNKIKTYNCNENNNGVSLPDFFLNYKESFDLKRQLMYIIILNSKTHMLCCDTFLDEINNNTFTYNEVHKSITLYIKRCEKLIVKDYLTSMLSELELKYKYGIDYVDKQQLVYKYIDEFLETDCLNIDSFLKSLNLTKKDIEIYKGMIQKIRENDKEIDTKIAEKYLQMRNKQYYLLRQEHELLLEYLKTQSENNSCIDILLKLHCSLPSIIDFEYKNDLFSKEKILKFLTNINKKIEKSDAILLDGNYNIKGYTLTEVDKQKICDYIDSHKLPRKQIIFREVARKFVTESGLIL